MADHSAITSLGSQANSYIQEIIMNLRNAAIAVIASSLLAVPAAATASPVPEPRPPTATDTVEVAIDQLTKDYASARLSDQRSIHNEIVLLINVGRPAL